MAYLRPETAQGMFVNFTNVLQPTRKKPPFGIAQVGKSFRNEITPQNWIFRTREFEQMEMEFFVPPADGPQVVRVLVHTSGSTGTSTSASRATCCACVPTTPTSCRTTRPARPTSSSCSRGAGTSSRASPSAPTTTSPSTPNHSGEKLDYFDQATNERYKPYVDRAGRRRHPHCRRSSCSPPTTRTWSTTSRAPCCASTRDSRPTRSPCSRCRRRTR